MVLKCTQCGDIAKARGLCAKHYMAWRHGADYDAPLLAREQRYPAKQCLVEGCPDPARTGGLCVLHYTRKLRGQPLDRPSKVGERRPGAKLTVVKVKAIRRKHSEGVSMASLARSYRVSETAIDRLVKRKTWKHVA